MGPDHVRPSARSVTIILTAAVALIATARAPRWREGRLGQVLAGESVPARLSVGKLMGLRQRSLFAQTRSRSR